MSLCQHSALSADELQHTRHTTDQHRTRIPVPSGMVTPLWVTNMDVRSAYWQFSVSSQHNGEKFDHESLHQPILFETLHPYLVNKLDPPHIGLFGPSWSELSPSG